MRALCLALVTLLTATSAHAEGCRVTNGVDYRFERRTAVRTSDEGRITLAVYVYRPLKQQRNAVALFSHGSTGGYDFDPKEPQPIVQCSLKNYFLSRGYTLVAFPRRGRGESTGRYVEECDRHTDRTCTPAATRQMSDRAIAEGLADLTAVADQVVFSRLVRKDTALLLVGHSRGAVLSLAYAAAHPTRVAGVLNFSGGWLGQQRGADVAAENARRDAYQEALFARLGRYPGPTLWLYADRDPLYDEATTRLFHAAYLRAGGRGDYRQVHAATLENGHLLIQESPLWADAADALLGVPASGP